MKNNLIHSVYHIGRPFKIYKFEELIRISKYTMACGFHNTLVQFTLLLFLHAFSPHPPQLSERHHCSYMFHHHSLIMQNWDDCIFRLQNSLECFISQKPMKMYSVFYFHARTLCMMVLLLDMIYLYMEYILLLESNYCLSLKRVYTDNCLSKHRVLSTFIPVYILYLIQKSKQRINYMIFFLEGLFVFVRVFGSLRC